MKLWWRERGWPTKLALATWPAAAVGSLLLAWLLPGYDRGGAIVCYWYEITIQCRGTGADIVLSYLLSLPWLWISYGWFALPVGILLFKLNATAGILLVLIGCTWHFATWQLLAFLAAAAKSSAQEGPPDRFGGR